MTVETLYELYDQAVDMWCRAIRAELKLLEAIGDRQPTPKERDLLAEVALIKKRTRTSIRWIKRGIRMMEGRQ